MKRRLDLHRRAAKPIVVVVVSLIGTYAIAEAVSACTCALPSGTQQAQIASAKRTARAVFGGTVSEVRPHSGVLRVEIHFAVERVWKGRLPAEVVVTTGIGGGDCGYRFEPGARYVVYCSGDTIEALSTNICTRTCLMKDARDDVRYLGRAKHSIGRSQMPN
jgi:hypothetical protein